MARILVVDDEPDIRRILSSALDRMGHTVLDAEDGVAALRLCQTVNFDVAIVDHVLPGPTGRELLARLRHVQPWCMRILFTGQLGEPETLQAFNAGEMQRFLRKPCQVEELQEAVDDVLELGRQLRVLVDGGAEDRQAGRRFVEAVESQQLSLEVQPIYRTSDLSLAAVECLLRSSHPDFPGPKEVLEAVEASDLLARLGREVTRLAAGWVERLPSDVLVFVNAHPEQFGHDDLLYQFAPLLPVADRVVIEITERASLIRVPGWEVGAARLLDAGFRLAVDDFGAGSHGLRMLAEIQPHFLKVDAEIVRHADHVTRKQRLLQVVGSLCASMGMEFVAEGVETAGELETAVRAGAHYVQGFHLAHPSADLPANPAPVRR